MSIAQPLPLLDLTPAPAPSSDRGPSLEALSARLRAALGVPVRYHLVTLGCPKNTVDSERFERGLATLGCLPVTGPGQADVLVANTCGFIEQSQQESIEAVLGLGARKRRAQRLITAGCLVTLNRDELATELPEVDGFFDPREWDSTTLAVAGHGLLPDVSLTDLRLAIRVLADGGPPAAALTGLYDRGVLARLPEPATETRVSVTALLADLANAPLARFDLPSAGTPARGAVSAYMKISDGCNAPCTFCIIPQIKGRLTSTRAADLVAEAIRLRQSGVRELVLVAQDSTAYGEDVGGRDSLPDLLRLLADAVPDAWLRLMYAYPGRVSDRLIAAMAETPQVVKYLDVPLQHGAVATLRRMRRPANVAMVRRMIADLRAAMPEIALRTSFITGFPGETDSEFEELADFVREIRFDRVGVFTYSQQERAVSGGFADQVPERVKRQRRRQLMEIQQEISLDKHRELIGRELTVLVESDAAPSRRSGAALDGPVVAGRSHRDAPEVDGVVLSRGVARPGEFVRVRVTSAMPYDLAGDIIGPAHPFQPAR